MKRKAIPKTVKDRLLVLCNNACMICSEPYTVSHHIEPICEGGSNDWMNLIVICPNCHHRVHILKDINESQLKMYRQRAEDGVLVGRMASSKVVSLDSYRGKNKNSGGLRRTNISQQISGDHNAQSIGDVTLMNRASTIENSVNAVRSQKITGNNNTQLAGNVINVIAPKQPQLKISPPADSIGSDSILKTEIQTRFNRLGEERAKRLGNAAYAVMYRKFKADFKIKNGNWTIIWTWPKDCAPAIIEYLNDKYDNTIKGRIERASRREGYIHTRPILYKKERDLLSHFDLNLDSEEVRRNLKSYFGVQSHAELTHLQHWQWVCHLEHTVRRIEET